MTWINWVRQNWGALKNGQKLRAPGWLDHPRERGFKRVTYSMPRGQVGDWGLPLSDGSRIHVREFPDGRLIVHRDRHDPQRGITGTLAHLMTETPVGLLTAIAVLGVAGGESG